MDELVSQDATIEQAGMRESLGVVPMVSVAQDGRRADNPTISIVD